MTQKKKKHFSFGFFLLGVSFIMAVLLDCANKMAPTGGPRDETPPRVVSSFPAPDSVGITSLDYIEIRFSEDIRQTSLLNNYWIIPEISGKIEVKWKGGARLRFLLPDSLQSNQTYVFTLGTGIADRHNNNLAGPFRLAFSTGSALDSGSVQGSVYSQEPLKDVFIYAYPLPDTIANDSMLFHKARYYTQADAEDRYKLNYLPLGKYRVIALQDNDYNQFYNIQSDLIGIPFADISVDSLHPAISNLNFYLIREDTTAPGIQSIDTVHTRCIDVEFDESIILLNTFSVEITDTLTGKSFLPKAISLSRDERKNLELYFDSLAAGQPMILSIKGVSDLAGNIPADSVVRKKFTSPVRSDTLPPRIPNLNTGYGSDDVPYDASITLAFHAPIDSAFFRKAFSMFPENKKPVPGDFDFQNLREPRFTPWQLLQKNSKYTVQLHLDSLRDLFGRAFPDTVITYQFTTQNWAELGEISGVVRAENLQWAQAIIEARPLSGSRVFRTVAKTGEKYLLEYLPGGLYFIRAIVDVNINEQWDRGQTDPWRFSEPVIFKPDTIKVRKRWTTEEKNFRFYFRQAHGN